MLVTAEEIERAFGEKVRDTLLDVTEPDLPGLSWETREARYRRRQTALRPSLLVARADKIANLISMIAAHATGVAPA